MDINAHAHNAFSRAHELLRSGPHLFPVPPYTHLTRVYLPSLESENHDNGPLQQTRALGSSHSFAPLIVHSPPPTVHSVFSTHAFASPVRCCVFVFAVHVPSIL